MAGRGAYLGKAELIQQALCCRFRPGGTNSARELLRRDSLVLCGMNKVWVTYIYEEGAQGEFPIPLL